MISITDGVFIGRADSQVKSRGYRIELGEVETALRVVEGVDDSAVVAIDLGGFDGLPAAIARSLGSMIPKYMVPQRWLRFDRLPTNVNGKIDRPSVRSAFEEASKP